MTQGTLSLVPSWQLALPAGPPAPVLLPAAPGMPVQLSLNGGPMPVLAPSLTIDLAMPLAEVWCDSCDRSVLPVEESHYNYPNDSGYRGWNLYPCHIVQAGCGCWIDSNSEGRCSNCEGCDECCDCPWCEGCEENVSHHDICNKCSKCDSCCSCVSCAHCDCKDDGTDNTDHGDKQCENGCGFCNDHCGCERRRRERCDCPDCKVNRNGGINPDYEVPGWMTRGDAQPTTEPEDSAEATYADRMLVNPVQCMADFYAADYVMAVIGKASLFGSDVDRYASILRASAKALQDWIVSLCDPVFQDYVFMAIGGEARHHLNVRGNVPSGRESSWDYWFAMGQLNGRENLTRDCVALFGDESWGGSYGGRKWQVIAEVLLARLDGTIDAKTFVDRVFTLQHNGGSLLNKLSWKDSAYVQDCIAVGNAHASDKVDFPTLGLYASADGKALLYFLSAIADRFVPAPDRPMLSAIASSSSMLPYGGNHSVPFFPKQGSNAAALKSARFRSLLAREEEAVRQERHTYWSVDLCQPWFCDCGCRAVRTVASRKRRVAKVAA